jgi:CRP-like cAMP-binding protein
MIAIMSSFIEQLGPLLTRRIEAAAGTSLFRQGQPVRDWYVVRRGCVQLVRYGEDGAAAVMQRAAEGELLAESSIFSPAYHCDGVVVSDALLDRADMTQVRRALHADPEFLRQFAQHLAREVQRTRSRVEILTRKTVAARLDGWLTLNDGRLPECGSWRALAEDIQVSPEAFYREVKRRRERLR